MPAIHQCGVITYPNLRPDPGKTRRGEAHYQPEGLLPDVGIHLYELGGGEPIHLDGFAYCPADI